MRHFLLLLYLVLHMQAAQAFSMRAEQVIIPGHGSVTDIHGIPPA